jgi:hypothetical protein
MRRPASASSARSISAAVHIRPAMSPILSMVTACHGAGQGSCQTPAGSLI